MAKYAVLDSCSYNESYISFIEWSKDVNDFEHYDHDDDPIKEVDIPEELIERYKQIMVEKESIEDQIRELYKASKKILKTDYEKDLEIFLREQAEAKRKARKEKRLAKLNNKYNAKLLFKESIFMEKLFIKTNEILEAIKTMDKYNRYELGKSLLEIGFLKNPNEIEEATYGLVIEDYRIDKIDEIAKIIADVSPYSVEGAKEFLKENEGNIIYNPYPYSKAIDIIDRLTKAGADVSIWGDEDNVTRETMTKFAGTPTFDAWFDHTEDDEDDYAYWQYNLDFDN
jgi:hypothetical protein